MKRCSMCEETKPATEFYWRKASRDGLQGSCKPCCRLGQRRSRERNREVLAERARRYYWANREAALERSKRWREENHDAYLEGKRRWREANREAEAESNRHWYGENRGDRAAYRKRSHVSLRGETFAHFGEECAWCGSTERLELDHVNGDGREHREAIGMPRGGDFYAYLRGNGWDADGYELQVLCHSCHRAKTNDERNAA